MNRLRQVMTCTPLRVLSWLLIASLVFAGMPVLKIHAHADPVPGHHDQAEQAHHDHHNAMVASDAGDGPAPESQLHAHDATTLAFAPPVLPPLMLTPVPVAAPPVPVLTRRDAVPLLPLQRPPIA